MPKSIYIIDHPPFYSSRVFTSTGSQRTVGDWSVFMHSWIITSAQGSHCKTWKSEMTRGWDCLTGHLSRPFHGLDENYTPNRTMVPTQVSWKMVHWATLKLNVASGCTFDLCAIQHHRTDAQVSSHQVSRGRSAMQSTCHVKRIKRLCLYSDGIVLQWHLHLHSASIWGLLLGALALCTQMLRCTLVTSERSSWYRLTE